VNALGTGRKGFSSLRRWQALFVRSPDRQDFTADFADVADKEAIQTISGTYPPIPRNPRSKEGWIPWRLVLPQN
jgi:hypothetical protein